MLDNIHVIINKKEQFNFWKQEIYNDNDFVEACLNINLLLKEGLCRKVNQSKEELGKTK